MLSALANGAEWPRALHVASEMMQKDETSYNTLNFGWDSVAKNIKNGAGESAQSDAAMPPRIDALARGGQWEASLCILQVMLEETKNEGCKIEPPKLPNKWGMVNYNFRRIKF